jgi:multiple antibiotic resistance protein
MNDLAFFAAVFVTLFAIVDPLGTLPFFVALTEGFGPPDRAIILRRAVLVLGTVLAVFALFGQVIFVAFGFTLAAFEIAGGILLFMVAYDMLRGEIARARLSPQDHTDGMSRRDELSVVPLGIPLLAGPGAISTVMIYVGGGGGPVPLVLVLVAIAIVTVSTFFIFRYGERIFRVFGRVGLMAVTRVLGLILAAVGVQFVITGVLAVTHL